MEYFRYRKKEIASYLQMVFEKKQGEFSRINSFGRDVCDRLYEFSAGGKMIRGGLVSLGYSLFNGERDDDSMKHVLIQAGAAMELFQSALLVHDDIMDRDTYRRGLKSIYYQYAEMVKSEGKQDNEHLGESLGICVGDVAFFLAFEILAGLSVPPDTYREIMSLTSKEISYVGIAQMQDVYNGALKDGVPDREILKLYLYKTGRYTFSLPLMVGGLLAGQDAETIASLEKLGEYLGMVFQVKDDELGLFGDTESIGKPVGTDIKESKKTLFYGYLFELASPEDREKLKAIFGNEDIGESEVRYIQTLVDDLGIRGMTDFLTSDLADKAERTIESLGTLSLKHRDLLQGLLDYSLKRVK